MTQEFNSVSEEEAMKGGRWYSAEDIDPLIRELDQLLNGDDCAKQARLCDIVSQVAGMSRESQAVIRCIFKVESLKRPA